MSTCRYCLAAWGDIGWECEHDEREAAVARQLAVMVHGADPTDEQIGWFMEDAATICAVVPSVFAPTVTHWNDRTMRFRAGGVGFRVNQDEGGGLIWKDPK